ncbi:MAG: Rab family GTPase [Candidatus Hermodarchaeota archaeon]
MSDGDNDNFTEILIKFTCPTCKAARELKISTSIISKAKGLSTISIQKDQICEHHFQAFVDKNFKVRGYQKVDFEINLKKKIPKGKYDLKIIIIGDYKVGKTAVTKQFLENSFDETYIPTLHLKVLKKDIKIDEADISLVIWDIGGQAFHMSPYRDQFYQGAQLALVLVDRTRKKTLEHVELWIKDTLKSIPDHIPIILLGNKSDLTEEIIVSEQDIKSEADRLDVDYLLTSAKTGENIDNAFYNLTQLYFASLT